jgi:hypothetical protein
MTESNQMNHLEAKAIYEMTKLASVANFIMTDFITTIALTMFKSHLSSYTEPQLALELFMEEWEDKIIKAKEEEIEILLSQQDSMADMLVGNTIAETISLEDFKAEVREAKEALTSAMLSDLE